MILPNKHSGYFFAQRIYEKGGKGGGIIGSILKPVTSVVGAVTGASSAEKAAKKQAEEMKRANAIAQQQAKTAEEQLRAANAKSPDVDTIKTENASGLGSTMLTGAEGTTLGASNKRRKTLLGG